MPAPTPDPSSVLNDFERDARRCETPCGDGTMVWRMWGEGPPIILFHGAQGAWSHWIGNIEALSRTRSVWAADLPGHGDSAMPDAEDHEVLSRVLADGLRQLPGAQFPLDIVGFSFGGVVAGQLAARHPELVRRVIVVDSGGLDTPLRVPQLRQVRGLKGEERHAALRHNLLASMIHDPDQVDELAMHVLIANGYRARLNVRPLVLPDRLLEVLPQISCQVDAIWGENDQTHFDPAVQLAAMRAVRPDVEMRVIPAVGHWAMYEGAAAFNAMLLKMLDEPLRRLP